MAQEWDNSDQLCQGALPLKDDKHILLSELHANHKSHAECWFNTKSSVCPAENQNQSNLIFSVETTTVLSLHHTSLSTFLGFNGWGIGKAPARRGNSELPAQSSSEILPLHPGSLSKPNSSHSTLGLVKVSWARQILQSVTSWVF